jgi:serine/threonine-protein kinase
VSERDSIESLPTSTLGQYRIRGRLGSGGMGDVFDAVHVTLDKRVAIKTLRRRFLEDEVVVARFLREGQLASRMRHPNIVDVTDVGVIDGLPCLVMEHLEGETLSQLIRRDGPMRPSALVDYLLPILAAVDFAHDHGVLHRDLKPSNIFLARSWNGEIHPKVLDFGISKLVHEATEAALTTDSAFVGTPHYASPETIRAEKAVDRRADQYSMGVILYEGTTGVRPFAEKGGSFVSMALAICQGDFQPPRTHNPELPEAFERVILRAMSLSADDRFLGMRQLGAALLPFASERARVIWAPTFVMANGSDVRDARDEGPSHNTQILRGSDGMPALVAHPVSSPGHAPLSASGSGPVVVQPPPPPNWPQSGVRTYPPMHAPLNFGGPHGGGLPVLSASAQYPQFTPMAGAMHDRTPSFGAGIGTSIHAHAPKRSSTAAITVAVLALIAAGLVGVLLTRMSARRAAASGEADVAAAANATTYAIDVQTSPESAALELDGVAVGSGQLVKQLPRDGQQHVLRVSAPGYETLLVQFDETRRPPNVMALHASAAGMPSTTLAGKSPGAGPRPPAPAGAGPQAPANARPGQNVKGKPERPRTDNIDPWE